MQQQLQQRLQQLRQEYGRGQQALADLLDRKTELEQTLLRISGAIQVLEELLDVPAGPPGTSSSAGAAEPASNGAEGREA
jgi:uncharacterized protein (DUF3084 family)